MKFKNGLSPCTWPLEQNLLQNLKLAKKKNQFCKCVPLTNEANVFWIKKIFIWLSPDGQSWKAEIDFSVSMSISAQISDGESVAETTPGDFEKQLKLTI